MESTQSLQNTAYRVFLSNKNKKIDQTKAFLLRSLTYPSHAGRTGLTATAGKAWYWMKVALRVSVLCSTSFLSETARVSLLIILIILWYWNRQQGTQTKSASIPLLCNLTSQILQSASLRQENCALHLCSLGNQNIILKSASANLNFNRQSVHHL